MFHIVLHGFLSSSSNFPLLGEVCYFSFKSRFLCWIHQTDQELQRVSWSVCNCSTLLKELKINHYKIRPRTPEHNGKVERSHRNDNERFYSWITFYSIEDLRKQGAAYLKRSNRIPMAILGYLTPKEKRAELEVCAA